MDQSVVRKDSGLSGVNTMADNTEGRQHVYKTQKQHNPYIAEIIVLSPKRAGEPYR